MQVMMKFSAKLKWKWLLVEQETSIHIGVSCETIPPASAASF